MDPTGLMLTIFLVAAALGVLGAIIIKFIELALKRTWNSWEFEVKRVIKKINK